MRYVRTVVTIRSLAGPFAPLEYSVLVRHDSSAFPTGDLAQEGWIET
jgi:hypothetical protein